jgi:hypothetical protein
MNNHKNRSINSEQEREREKEEKMFRYNIVVLMLFYSLYFSL